MQGGKTGVDLIEIFENISVPCLKIKKYENFIFINYIVCGRFMVNSSIPMHINERHIL